MRLQVMESRDLISVSRRIFASLGLEGLETLNIAKKWLIKNYMIQRFLLVVLAGKKHPKAVGKMQEILKNCKSELMTTFKKKFRQNVQILKSQVSVSSRNFNQVSVSKVTVSTTSLALSMIPFQRT